MPARLGLASLFFRSTYMTSETWYEMFSLWRTTFVQWTEGKKFVLSLGSISMGDVANFQKNYIESERKKKVQKNMDGKKKVQNFVKSSGYSVLELMLIMMSTIVVVFFFIWIVWTGLYWEPAGRR